jgi:hypothetical protein
MVPRITELERKLQDLQATADPGNVMINEFPGYRLLTPLQVKLSDDDGVFIARAPELDLWADGASRGEAIEELKGSLASLATDLAATPDARLGPRPQLWKALLARVAQRV